MSEKIRILIVDDQNIIRWGLISVLTGEENIEIVGEAVDGVDALEKVKLLQPDVILMDLVMPRMDGIAAIQSIIQDNPSARILVLSGHEDDQTIMAAINAGAMGFLVKDFDLDGLLNSIIGVYHDNVSIPKKVVNKWVQGITKPTTNLNDVYLTDSELKVLRLMSQGMSNKELAVTLSVSKSTVRTHVSNLLRKLKVSSRTKAVLYAIEKGLVEPNRPEK